MPNLNSLTKQWDNNYKLKEEEGHIVSNKNSIKSPKTS